MADEAQVAAAYGAQIRVASDDDATASLSSSIRVRHHRTPQVELSVDRATGGHMLHLALATCVFNNVLRIAQERAVTLTDLRVVADGGFNDEGTASTGITCEIELAGTAEVGELSDIADKAFKDSAVVAVLQRAGSVDLTTVRANA